LANVEDATMQAYYANELFGTRMAAKIIPLLNDGAAGLNELSEEFESLGYLSEETVNELDAFEDVIDRIKYQITLVKNTIGASFLPLMEAMANFVETKVVPALQKVADWFETLDVNQQKFLAGALAFAAALAPILLIAGKMTSGIGSMIGMIAKLGTAISGLSASLGVIGLIAGVFALLYASNEDFRESINNLVGTLFNSLKPVLDTLMDTLGVLMDALMPILNMLANLLVPIIDILVAVLEPLLTLFSNLANVVLTILGDRLESIMSRFKVFVDIINKYVVPVITFMAKVIEEFYGGIADGFDKAFNWIFSGLEKAVEFINTIISKLNVFGDKLGISALSNLKDIDINVKAKATGSVSQETAKAANNAVTQSTVTQVSEVATIDNSTQTITIEEGAFQVNNYAEGLDAEELAEDLYQQFNLRLAKGM
jgi:phage-related protein